MAGQRQGKFSENEIAKSTDFIFDADSKAVAFGDFIFNLAGATKNLVMYGLTVTQATPPSMNIIVKAGMGLNISDKSLLYEENDSSAVSVINGDTLDRYDTVQIQFKKTDYDTQQRAFKDPITNTITYQNVETKQFVTIDIQVKKGTAGGGSAPAPDAGWVKIAEIFVAANNSTSILNANIFGITATQISESNTAWTSGQSTIYRINNFEAWRTAFLVKHAEDGTFRAGAVGTADIAFGLGGNQVDASDIPVPDTASDFTTDDVSSALHQLADAGTKYTVQSSGYSVPITKPGDLVIFTDGTSGFTVTFPALSTDVMMPKTVWIFNNNTSGVITISGADSAGTVDIGEWVMIRATESPNGTPTRRWVIAYSSFDLPDHIAVQSAGIHGSTSAATANKLVHRDAAGRAKIVDPTSTDDIDSMGARDVAIATTAFKAPFRVSSPVNINIASPGAIIDNATMVAGDRVFLWKQTAQAENGGWTWNGAAVPMTRTSDFNTSAKISQGMIAIVNQDGDTYKNVMFTMNSNGPYTLGTTSLTWRQVSFALVVASDFNNLLRNGWYRIAAGQANAPEATLPYIVQHFQSDIDITTGFQIAKSITDTAEGGHFYIRNNNTGTWTAWSLIHTDGDQRWIDVSTTNTQLVPNKKYKLTDSLNVILPTSPVIGDVLEIINDGALSTLDQSQSSELIEYKKSMYTTSGAAGFLNLGLRDRVKLFYRGAGETRSPQGINSGALTINTGAVACVAISPDDQYIAFGDSTTPFVHIYQRTGSTWAAISNPGTLPTGQVFGVAFSPDGKYLACAHVTSPFITIYSISGGVFTKLTNPATLPTNNCVDVAFSPDSQYLIAAQTAGNGIIIYRMNGVGTPVKITDPAVLPTNGATGVDYSPDGQWVAVRTGASPFILIYQINGETYTTLGNPSTLPSGTASNLKPAFSPDSRFLAVPDTSSPFLLIYEMNKNNHAAVPTKLPNPAVVPVSSCESCFWSKDGRYLASIGSISGANQLIYRRVASTFTSAGSFPGIVSNPNRVIWSNDGRFIISCAQTGTGRLYIDKTYSAVTRQWTISEFDSFDQINDNATLPANGNMIRKFN